MMDKPVYSLRDLMGLNDNSGIPSLPASESGESPLTPEQLQTAPSQMPQELDNSILGSNSTISQILKSTQGTPKSISEQAPLTPEQLQQGAQIPNLQREEPVVPTAKTAPRSAIKDAFQATQSPEQKEAAQNAADAKNPLEDAEMKTAMESSRQNRENAAFQSSLAQIMAGMGSLGGGKVNVNEEPLKALAASANAPVTDINTQRDEYKKFLANKEDRESQDPNSQTSKFYRDSLESLLPEGSPLKGKLGSMSRSDMEKAMPTITQAIAKKQHEETLKAKYAEIGANKQLADANKQNVRYDKEVGDYRNKIMGLGRSGHLMNQWNKVDSIEHALGLIDLHTKEGKTTLTPQESYELQMALANALANGGHATDATLKHLSPPNAPTSIASAINAVTGGATTIGGKGYQEQIGRLKHNLQNQAQISSDIIKKAGKAAQHRDPSIAKVQQEVLDKSLSEYSQSLDSQKGTEVSQNEHNEALKWAIANPTDPRADKILKAQGVK